jgi:sugar fermentation stimulation protein A
MKLFQKLEKAIFHKRLNRFVVECTVDNKLTRAYLPNPGRLYELLLPGSTLYLTRDQSDSGRKFKYTAIAVEKGTSPVLLHTHLNNIVARWLIEQRLIPGLENVKIVKSEVTLKNSRFDFLLRKGQDEIVLEVKSCTLFNGKIAMFPDALTVRGSRHLL